MPRFRGRAGNRVPGGTPPGVTCKGKGNTVDVGPSNNSVVQGLISTDGGYIGVSD